MVVATALLYVALFAVPAKAVDKTKSMGPDIRAFTAQIKSNIRPRIAGYNFNETMMGCFYFYDNWTMPQLGEESRLKKIICATDPEFDSVIVNRDHPRPEAIAYIDAQTGCPYRILAEKYTGSGGKHARGLFWIKGLTQP